MSIRNYRISEESSTMGTNQTTNVETYGFIDHHGTEQIYSKEYQLLSCRNLRSSKNTKIPTISLDMNLVDKTHMKTLLLDLKREKKIIKIHRRVRKRYNYLNYPFYKHESNIHSSSLENIQFL